MLNRSEKRKIGKVGVTESHFFQGGIEAQLCGFFSYTHKIVIPTMIQNTNTTCRNAELIQTTKLFRLLKFFDFATTTTSVLSFKNESAEKGKENLTAKTPF